jgi:hypothetical protein
MASTYLSKTFGSNSVSNRKFTYSFWIKRSGLGECTMTSAYSSGTYFSGIKFLSDDRFELYDYRGSYILQKVTSRKFRDTNAWYHIVIASDTSVSTPNTKIYINGVQETAFDTNTDYNQNASTSFNHSYNNTIGAFGGSSYQQYVDGLMSHFHFCDGYTYQASDFGETDSTSGIWKIKTSPSVSYGTNGFFILKDGNNLSGSTVQDQSGQSNNWTVGGGTLTDLKDNPSNNYATINSLYKHSATYANGNLKSTNASNKFGGVATIGVSTGKWYAEFKYGSNSNEYGAVGIYGDPGPASNANQGVGKQTNSYSYRSDAYKLIENTDTSYGTSYGNGDIVGIALDLDNNKLYFSKNGTWQNSGDPTSGSTGTGAIPISLTSNTGFWFIAANSNSGSNTAIWEHNYGNGYFGTTAITSAGSNGNGSLFEYDVPSGYYALNTKNINTYG